MTLTQRIVLRAAPIRFWAFWPFVWAFTGTLYGGRDDLIPMAIISGIVVFVCWLIDLPNAWTVRKVIKQTGVKRLGTFWNPFDPPRFEWADVIAENG